MILDPAAVNNMPQEYSIWLVPDEASDAYSAFDNLITEYSQKYSDAPDFKPHVTVMGGIEDTQEAVEECAEVLAKGREQMDLKFIDASCSVTDHQCVFVLVEPSAELLTLHENALDELYESASMFVPHLSLIYSDMDIEDRAKEVQSIKMDSLPETVKIDSIEIFDTTGPVSNWEQIATYPLVERP